MRMIPMLAFLSFLFCGSAPIAAQDYLTTDYFLIGFGTACLPGPNVTSCYTSKEMPASTIPLTVRQISCEFDTNNRLQSAQIAFTDKPIKVAGEYTGNQDMPIMFLPMVTPRQVSVSNGAVNRYTITTETYFRLPPGIRLIVKAQFDRIDVLNPTTLISCFFSGDKKE